MFQAARSGDQAPVDLRTQDITGHTVSVLVREGQTLRALPVLPRGEPLPASATLRGLRTRRDGQRTLDLWLLQGEGTDPEAATPLGCMSFHGLSPEPAGANVELEVRHGVDGLVVVEARGSDGRPLPHQVGPPEVPLRDLVAGKLPMDVVIVLDSSGSMYGPPFAEGCALAQQLVESVRGPNRRVGLISTSSEAVEDLRADVGPLLRTLRAIVPVGAGSLAGALERAGTWLDQGVCRHRVAVLITDALLEDAEGCAEAASRLGARGVDVHVVHVGDRGDASLLAMFAQGRGAITRAAPSLAPQESIPELHRA
jgi:Mg-chelatase subunit ChlD